MVGVCSWTYRLSASFKSDERGSTPGEPGLHRSHGDPELIRDLLHRQVHDMVQDHDGSLSNRQRAQRRTDSDSSSELRLFGLVLLRAASETA